MEKVERIPTIEAFLSKYVKKPSRHTYRAGLKKYFAALNTDPETYFNNNRDYADDLMKFAQSMQEKPPKTFNVYTSAIKKFLIRNKAMIEPFVWEDMKTFRTGTRAATVDRLPTNEELKNILTQADLKTRSIGLVLSSSGMRVGEACQIQLDDIDWKNKPIKINVRGEYTKSGNGRYVFISNEAADVLKQWLKVRESYLVNAAKRINIKHIEIKKNVEDNRVFPISTSMVRYLWNNCLKNAECAKRDKTTKYHELHIHVLRKRFLSLLKLEIPEVIVEALAGHDAYLSEAYRRYTPKQMGSYYLKGVSSLLVFERESDDVSHIKDEQAQLRDENKALQNEMQERKMEILELRLTLQELKNKKN